MVKNPPVNARDMGDLGSIPGRGISPGEGNGKPTPVFLSGETHGQRSLVGCKSIGSHTAGQDLATEHLRTYKGGKTRQEYRKPSFIHNNEKVMLLLNRCLTTHRNPTTRGRKAKSLLIYYS